MSRIKTNNQPSSIYQQEGYTPPHNLELEQSLIGALISYPTQVIYLIKPIVYPSDFHSPNHEIIVQAIYDLEENSIIPELSMVASRLQDAGMLERIGGPQYLVKCSSMATGTTVANIEKVCLAVKQLAVGRNLIRISQEIMGKAYMRSDVFDIIEFAEVEYSKINQDIAQVGVEDVFSIATEAADSFLGRIKRAQLALEDPTVKQDDVLYTGITKWDEINGPLQPHIYVVAARPGMGKTAFIVQMICNMATRHPVGLINGEMTNTQMCNRVICNSQELNNYVILRKDPLLVTEDEKAKYLNGQIFFTNLQLFIESKITEIGKIYSKVKYWVLKHNIKILIIDFLQILTVADELAKWMSETQALNYILESIRRMSKEFKIPIILLSQLNRELYRRAGDKRPNLSDLKGSGKIEEIAYQISFLHRPEYYGIMEDDEGNTHGCCYQIIAKHRDGELGTVKHRFLGEFSKFDKWQGELGDWKPPVADIEKPTFIPKGHSIGSFDEDLTTDLPF
jgi:replicative DNA helicase